ncbi:hypothetical protein PUNSTDRAFT_52184 [Punctularia strigosozonata HHB-11173 SS5]|uniref:uncharacterized protein n=1 Tax=Punctularia strigosozonata (strain HHB-11173) TaxID=741275 RepID=UPI00044165D1|nr:uncharacterized protein PUNSTDRAFT_52184 [Punctularia strigosozonata HHB-11173 SS5]EIN10096.1 hypothetical protein PUNSTDRAFT_52184 [Punctularia strigosozonata HHB-11173 SS5]
MSSIESTAVPATSAERSQDLLYSLTEIKSRVQQTAGGRDVTLVAVSKYKPSSDVLACYNHGQRDFGENYVQELVDKAAQLPTDIRWHFIGTLQSNKAKILAAIPNLYAVQTVASVKAASGLDKALSNDRTAPLNVLIQVNTSGEDAKSGLSPLTPSTASEDAQLVTLARYIVTSCPRLRLQGLMTIGSVSESLAKDKPNHDFETLKETRDSLERILRNDRMVPATWGEDGKLLLSMGMSSDFEAALSAGSDIVRVGTGIFGERHKKGES